MKPKTYLFDLDGTLTDPKEGITKSVAYALQKFHIEIDHLDKLCCFIGPPLKDSFMEYYNFSETEAEQAIVYYREYFSKKGLFQNKPYPRIEELLDKLKKKGCPLYVATSKPELFAIQILEHFHLNPYFDGICGATMDGSRSYKKDVIQYALDTYHIDKKTAVMVGDRKHDMMGAKACDLEAVGVLYGYGTKEELLSTGADHLISSVEEWLHELESKQH